MVEYLTQEQLEKLKDKLKYLQTVKLKEVAKLLNDAIAFGDLSENAAYTEAKEKQAFLQVEISELQEKIRGAKIIKKQKNDKVQIGSKVLVSSGKEKIKFEIVSLTQSDPLAGKISFSSPVGKALMGKSTGESVKVNINGEKPIIYKILKIE